MEAALGCFRMQHKCTFLSLYYHLSFMPCLPYPPLRGAFLQRGRLTMRESRHLIRPSGIASYIFAPLRHFACLVQERL